MMYSHLWGVSPICGGFKPTTSAFFLVLKEITGVLLNDSSSILCPSCLPMWNNAPKMLLAIPNLPNNDLYFVVFKNSDESKKLNFL